MDGPLVVRQKIHQIFQSPRYKDNKLSSANVYGMLSPSTSYIREALAFDKFAGVLLRSAGGGCKWSAAAIKWRAAVTSGSPHPSSARLQDDFAIRLPRNYSSSEPYPQTCSSHCCADWRSLQGTRTLTACGTTSTLQLKK